MSKIQILDAKEELKNFIIECKSNKWFNSVIDFTILDKLIEKTKYSKSNIFEYEVPRLVFKDIYLGRHIKPSKVAHLYADQRIELSVFFKGEYKPLENKIYDNIENLGVNILIKCTYCEQEDLEAESYWHLDKHKNANEKLETIHPLYHFEYGGSTTTEKEGFDFGKIIILDVPRIMHPPMDIILAIDFIIKNFYTYEQHQTLTEGKPFYKKCVQNAQFRLWRPYALALASNFENLDGIQVDENFATNIVECR
jgi:hypothetical protein